MINENDKILKAKVRIHNVRYPSSGHVSGDWAIVVFDLIEILGGKLDPVFDDTILAKGPMPKLKEGANYILEGKLVNDAKHGKQYEVISMRFDYDLTDKDDIRAFFTVFTTENIADALMSGKQNPIDLLETKNIGGLMKIKGIGPVTAARLCKRYEENKDHSRAYVALRGLGLTKYIIDKLIEQYRSPDVLIEKIDDNPYILIREVRGFGWKKCDDIARNKGFAVNSKERVEAYVQFYLYTQAESNGNSWVDLEELLLAVSHECSPILNEQLVAWVRAMVIDPKDFDDYYDKYSKGVNCPPIREMPLLFYEKQRRRIGLLEYRILEKEIARHISRLSEAKSSLQYDKDECLKLIAEVEKEQGYQYTEEQKETIWKILDNNVSVLTGLAGSGKSSTIAAVSHILTHYNQRIEQCALSGRASSKLSELTHMPGKTIHRLLAYLPEKGQFSHSERNPLSADAVILDETSMVGGELFLSLIRAVKDGAKFIMIGDVHQLESIGMCNIFKDCINSGYVSSTVLTKIHRQAARSGIITQSLKVAQGQALLSNDFLGTEIRGELKDFKIISTYTADLVQTYIIQEFKDMLKQGVSPSDIQVIVPMRVKGNISCMVLNEVIQNIVNPKISNKDAVVEFVDNGFKYNVRFKVNDRIIVCRNNYHALGVDNCEKAIFNGNVGYIKDIGEDMMLISLPEQGDVLLDKEDWTNIQLAYAITVHKKQGDSVPYAIIGYNSSCYALGTKELLYTAITRARTFCTVVTVPTTLNSAIKKSKVTLKQTWLCDDLIAISTQKEDF